MPRKTAQAQKPKKVQDSRSIKELFALRKRALFSAHNARKGSGKRSKKGKKSSSSWLDSIMDRIYKALSQMSVFISWGISWLLCFMLWAVLFYLVWRELLWWEFV
ncbi:hypothetical protein [Helicobacter labetoulli]|uniref:hypothetical protein n=1 Tax=Helicobacter labetoulli TaxID=2315333 RepID=UPI000EF6C1A3|nr:hypothetical protein [Helicobacter labetoulli]